MSSVEIRRFDVPTPDGAADAVLAVPSGAGPFPGVLFLMDAFGLRPTINGMVERLASHGYAVLAPNLFYRDARSPIVEDLPALMQAENREKLWGTLGPLMQALTPERLVSDGGAYLDALGKVASQPFGVVGYCMGGRAAFRVAAAYPDRVGALASFHGGNLATGDGDSPHRLLDRVRAEVYVGHADQDHSMPPEQIDRLEEALRASGLPYRTELYEGAPHGWTMADTAAYREDAAKRHWDRLLDLFGRKLRLSSAT